MHVVHHAHLPHLRDGGETRVPAADGSRGITAFEVWVRTLDPGAHTEALSHAGQLVVVALGGSGKLLIDGGPQRFHGACSLLIPPGCTFEIANVGAAELALVWVFTQPPQPVERAR